MTDNGSRVFAVPAAAKINLYLHVLGRRDNGYHELQSLVTFADIGDRVEARPADEWSLSLKGPFGHRLATEDDPADNLVLRAGRRLAAASGHQGAAALTLVKNLPIAAGIGGGSADAAATVRALAQLWRVEPEQPGQWADLGADIPVCLANAPTLVEGMGEKLTSVPALPLLPAVLVNPMVPSGTGAVFTALAGRFGAALPPPAMPMSSESATPVSVAHWLCSARNDLSYAALDVTPAVGEVLAKLFAAPDVLLARMSGSGATCFGLFASDAAAAAAAAWLLARQPNWWVKVTTLAGSGHCGTA